jgi:hypothetical protein
LSSPRSRRESIALPNLTPHNGAMRTERPETVTVSEIAN